MNVACSDLAASAVKADLRRRNERLVERYRLLRESVEGNERLVNLAGKYAEHVEKVRKMKAEQRAGLQRISDYVNRLSRDTSLTEEMLAQTAVDQRRVMDQIGALSQEMDYLTDDVK